MIAHSIASSNELNTLFPTTQNAELIMELVIAVAVGLFMGAIVALRYIAPKTKTTRDDAVLSALEKAEPLVEAIKPKQ